MIYGPMILEVGTRICILAQHPDIERRRNGVFVRTATITHKRGTKLHIRTDEGVLMWIDSMSNKLVGTLFVNTPVMPFILDKKDILQYIQVHNTNTDTRTSVCIREEFDNIIYDCIAVYKNDEDKCNSQRNAEIIPDFVYPMTLRFKQGDVVTASFILEEFEVRRTDTQSFAKIIKATMKEEIINNVRMYIPTYTVIRSYLGISQEDYNQQFTIRDVKLAGKQTMTVMLDATQQHVKKEFFDPFLR